MARRRPSVLALMPVIGAAEKVWANTKDQMSRSSSTQVGAVMLYKFDPSRLLLPEF